MSGISTHVLDTSRGRPASGVSVVLEIRAGENEWKLLGTGATDAGGRLTQLLPPHCPLVEGTYRLTFNTGAYFRAQKIEGLYPEVRVVFTVPDPAQHYHIPLLLSPNGYTTYRGS
jgi:5-hydroxyisourate hydrolase